MRNLGARALRRWENRRYLPISERPRGHSTSSATALQFITGSVGVGGGGPDFEIGCSMGREVWFEDFEDALQLAAATSCGVRCGDHPQPVRLQNKRDSSDDDGKVFGGASVIYLTSPSR